jgi:putative SOS response-associated peptidase YedK
MCGRYGFGNPARIATLPFAAPLPVFPARFNVTPSSEVPLVRHTSRGRDAVLAKWGLVPHWASDPAIGHRLANARGDSVADKPSFRDAFRERRGLMPADLFYEWQVIAGQKARQPWCLRLPEAAPFAFGALWERWRPQTPSDATGQTPLVTCTIITTEPNASVAPIHDRMPLIIAPADYDEWLDPATRPARALSLVRPFASMLDVWRVSAHVNSPQHDDPECIHPAS